MKLQFSNFFFWYMWGAASFLFFLISIPLGYLRGFSTCWPTILFELLLSWSCVDLLHYCTAHVFYTISSYLTLLCIILSFNLSSFKVIKLANGKTIYQWWKRFWYRIKSINWSCVGFKRDCRFVKLVEEPVHHVVPYRMHGIGQDIVRKY